MSDLTIANEIRRQIGGQSMFLMGASQLVGDENSLMFSIKGCRTINKIRIRLEANDTYTIEFFKYSPKKLECSLIESVEDVYCDMLHDVIESATGLYLTLYARN